MAQSCLIYSDRTRSNIESPSNLGDSARPVQQWFAIHTRSHFEAKTFSQLKAKAFETFLPQIAITSRRRDRRMKITVPMFPGYLFVHVPLTPEKHLDIVKCAGVVRVVGQSGRPVPVSLEEINNLMILDGSDHPLESCAYLTRGDRVRIMDGPLQGLTGIFLRRKGKTEKVIVSVDFLRTAVSVEVDDWSVERIA